MALLIRYSWLTIALLLFAASIPGKVYADDNLQLAEQEIKAGLLYNFLKYTEWPSSSLGSSAGVVVCVFGDDPFGGYLQPMAGRTVNQKVIIIRNVRDMQESLSCHLLFINANEKERMPKLMSFLKGKSVLTVSDFPGFTDAGGMIEFGRKDNHISVNLNMDAVRSSGLRVQDRLLKLVTVVHADAKESGR